MHNILPAKEQAQSNHVIFVTLDHKTSYKGGSTVRGYSGLNPKTSVHVSKYTYTSEMCEYVTHSTFSFFKALGSLRCCGVYNC